MNSAPEVTSKRDYETGDIITMNNDATNPITAAYINAYASAVSLTASNTVGNPTDGRLFGSAICVNSNGTVDVRVRGVVRIGSTSSTLALSDSVCADAGLLKVGSTGTPPAKLMTGQILKVDLTHTLSAYHIYDVWLG